MDAKAIMKEAQDANLTGRGMFDLIASRLGVDYLESCEVDSKSKPDSFNSAEEAFEKVGNIKAIWYHIPSMNLVLFDGTNKVGIRSTDFRVFGFGIKLNRIQTIIDGLESNTAAN